MSGKSDDNNNRKRRVVIVTGSGKGIGEAIAMEFAKAGYYVMINDFEKEKHLLNYQYILSLSINTKA